MMRPEYEPTLCQLTETMGLRLVVETLQSVAATLEKYPDFDPVAYLRELADRIVYMNPGAVEAIDEVQP